LIAICNTLINGLIFLTLCTLLHQRNASKWDIHCSSVEFGTDTTAQWLRYMKQTSTKDISSSQWVHVSNTLDSLTATGGEQDKQTHRNRGCSVTETWTNKRFPGRLMILSARKNDSCSWGVLPPISSLNYVCSCNMVYPALVNSLKLGAPNSCSWGALPPTTI